jgi:putative transposase
MITLLFHLFRLLPVLCGSHRYLALENLALRLQLAVYKKTLRRPKLHPSDRIFCIWLSRLWAEWRQALIIVTPVTVLRWHRRRFRDYWTKLSRRPQVGRPSMNAQITALVRKMAAANPLWGAPRIHGELRKLGIEVAEEYSLPPDAEAPDTSLADLAHVPHEPCPDLISIDFFTVPTAQLRVLFVLVVLAHHRRQVLHFNVTAHPTAAWTAQQIVDTFPTTPRQPISCATVTRSTVSTFGTA